MKWRGERKETIRNKEFRKACLSYGFDMEMWIKRKWRGERKETLEIKNSGTHVFPMVLIWKGV